MNLNKYINTHYPDVDMQKISDEQYNNYRLEHLSLNRKTPEELAISKRSRVEKLKEKRRLAAPVLIEPEHLILENSLIIQAVKPKERADKGKRRYRYHSSISTKYKSYIASANARKLIFELTVQEFEILCKGMCVYCALPATGIDRRDNRKGYTTSNAQSCCVTCNTMKRTMQEDHFIEQCQRIVSVYNNKQWQ